MVLKKFMGNEIILVGAFTEMCELANICSKKIVGIIDNNIKGSFYGIPIIGTDDDAPLLFALYSKTPIVISPDKPNIRKKLVEFYSNIGFVFTELISPLATISPTAEIGKGTVIQSLCNVSSDTKIGDFCKLNTLANVMHDNVIGNFTTIAPNAVLLGHVKIGESSYIGANSTILPMKEISDNVMVGAGAVVTQNIPSDHIVKGVPAR